MKLAALLAAALMLGACVSSIDVVEQATDDRPCELVLKLRAVPKKGLRKLGGAEDYGESPKARADAKIKRVDYDNLSDIVVVIEGPGQDKPDDVDMACNCPKVEITRDGFSSELVPATLLNARKKDTSRSASGTAAESSRGTTEEPSRALGRYAELTLTNRMQEPLNIFSSADSVVAVDVRLGPGESRAVTIHDEGLVDLYCEEDETIHCRVVVSKSAFVRRGRAGQDLKVFLPPGEFTVTVHAPRLPTRIGKVVMNKGTKTETQVTLGVNDLPKPK